MTPLLSPFYKCRTDGVILPIRIFAHVFRELRLNDGSPLINSLAQDMIPRPLFTLSQVIEIRHVSPKCLSSRVVKQPEQYGYFE